MPTPRTTRARRVPGHIAGRTPRRTPPAGQDPLSPANTETPAHAAPRPEITGHPRVSFWIRDVVVPLLIAVITGGIVAWGTIHAQKDIDDTRADRLLRAANLTFVRDKSSPDPDLPRPFNGIDLAEQNLSGLRLEKAELETANLYRANLYRANLYRAVMPGADLRDANLQVTNLRDADLTGAKLGRANLIGANLNGANLGRANLIGANLNGADLSNTELVEAGLSDAYLGSADLNGANLGTVDLRGANLGGADLRGASLFDANLRGAALNDVCWSESTSWGTFQPPPSEPRTCYHFDRLRLGPFAVSDNGR